MRCLTSEKAESSSASSDEDWCRTWRSCCHADQRQAQHSQSHSAGMGDVVCGQLVRSVRDQVDSGRDRCERVGRVIIRLYSQHFSCFSFSSDVLLFASSFSFFFFSVVRAGAKTGKKIVAEFLG